MLYYCTLMFNVNPILDKIQEYKSNWLQYPLDVSTVVDVLKGLFFHLIYSEYHYRRGISISIQ